MPAAWLKGYLQAQFKGVQFLIKGHSYSGGRRLAEHAFPQVEETEQEDLGRQTQTFTLDAYIIADNYYGQRNDLIEACNSEGAGLLQHPYLGVFDAHCQSISSGETTEEGRMVRFNLTFKEKSTFQITTVSNDSQANVFTAKQSILDSILEWFEEAYSIASIPSNAVQDALNAIDKGFEVVSAAKRLASTQAEFERLISNVEGRAIALSLNTEDLVNDMTDAVQFGTNLGNSLSLNATAENARNQYNELKQVAAWVDVQESASPVEISRDPNYPGFLTQRMTSYNAVAGLLGIFTVIDFDSSDEAKQFEDELIELVDSIQESDITDDLYQSFRAGMAAVHQNLEDRSISLPRIVEYKPIQPTNVLSLAHEIYGSVDQAEDISRRNGLKHPGFIPTNKDLKVRID